MLNLSKNDKFERHADEIELEEAKDAFIQKKVDIFFWKVGEAEGR